MNKTESEALRQRLREMAEKLYDLIQLQFDEDPTFDQIEHGEKAIESALLLAHDAGVEEAAKIIHGYQDQQARPGIGGIQDAIDNIARKMEAKIRALKLRAEGG